MCMKTPTSITLDLKEVSSPLSLIAYVLNKTLDSVIKVLFLTVDISGMSSRFKGV